MKTAESSEYLSGQLITYLGNKRALLPFIGTAVDTVRSGLGRERLSVLDIFAGSGAVSRFLKSYAHTLRVNDFEAYAEVIARCYLANPSDIDIAQLRQTHQQLLDELSEERLRPGFIAELYAPRDDSDIKSGERVFYTRRNACFLDTACRLIGELEAAQRPFFTAPLLAAASVHANTSGVFKGFHKNRLTGVGQFGGTGRDALSRITRPITLPFPLFSRFDSQVEVYRRDALDLARDLARSGETVDLAYLDPPYNQHPYGSNYFMLNLLVDYRRPEKVSPVSGIPPDWQRSSYYRKQAAAAALAELIEALPARFVLISFNSEGFIALNEMQRLLERFGPVNVSETGYATFRGSRNLSERAVRVTEYLFLLEKRDYIDKRTLVV